MFPPDLITTLMKQDSISGSRSTALKPLGWLVAMLLGGSLGCIYYSAPFWATVLMTSLTCAAVFLYMGCYVYFMCKSPDFLRSEKFSLQKLAIEKGLYGDSLKGFVILPPTQKSLPASGEQLEGGDK